MAFLETDALRVAVPGRVLIDDLALRLDAGLVVLLGPSGAGKTELLRTLLGLRHPDAGAVRLGGDDPAGLPPAKLARRVGYVPQYAADAVTEGTVREEVAATARALRVDADVDGAMRRLGVAHLADRHPWSLSGGERERVAVAAAVAHRPRLLVLDEPTTGLDVDGRARLRALLGDAGGLVVLATHEEEFARDADVVLHLADGRLREALAA